MEALKGGECYSTASARGVVLKCKRTRSHVIMLRVCGSLKLGGINRARKEKKNIYVYIFIHSTSWGVLFKQNKVLSSLQGDRDTRGG